MEKKSIIYIVLTAFFFGTLEVASKLGGASFNAIQLVFLRFLIGGVMLLPFAIHDLKKRAYKLTKSDLFYLLGLGVICVCISMAMLQYGVKRINANLASIIISMNPLFTMIFARFLVGEPFTKKKALVLVISFIGLLVVLNPATLFTGSIDPFGLIITLLAAISFGLFTAMGKKRLAKIGGMAQNSFSFLLGCAVLFIVMLVAKIPVVEGITLQSLPVLLYLGIFVTGAGYICFLKAIEIAGPSNASIAFFIKPVLAPVIAFLVLGEKFTWNLIVGIVIILIGSYINMRPEKKIVKEKKPVQAVKTV